MRREELYLADIVEAVDGINNFISGKSRESFLQDDLLRSAVLQKLTIIGEAAARLPKDFQQEYPEIEWADIAAFRNIAIHAYFSIDWNIVWVTATVEAPDLKQKIVKILADY